MADLSRTFFTSDHHFGHANIIKYCKRPFKTVEEMDAELIRRWNETVGPEDIVWHLGDFTLGGIEEATRYFSQLNGHINILCNPWHHDKRWLAERTWYDEIEGLPKIILKSPMVVLEIDELGSNLAVGMKFFHGWEKGHK